MPVDRSEIVLLGYFVGSSAIGGARTSSWSFWLSNAGISSLILSGPFNSISSKNYPLLRHLSLPSPSYIFLRLIRSKLLKFRILRFSLSRTSLFFRSLSPIRKSSNQRSSSYSRTGLFSYRFPSLIDLWILFCLPCLLILRPKVVIASHSPYVSLVAAYIYKLLRPASKLIVDYRDMWTLSRVYTGLPILRDLERYVERLVLNSADKVIVVSNGQAQTLSSVFTSISPVVIRNSSSLETYSQFPSPSIPSEPTNSTFNLLYAGTLYPNFQDPEAIFSALSHMRDTALISRQNFNFEILSPQIDLFSSLASKYNLLDFVNMYSFLPKEQCYQKMISANCFLLLEDMATESQGVMTSKLYDYLYIGRPILLHGVSPSSELYCYAHDNGSLYDLQSFPALVQSFYKGGQQSIPPFSQASASRRSFLALIQQLLVA